MQTQLAQSLGVSFASINRWENGQSRPSALAWRRILAAEEHGIDALTTAAPTPANSNGHAPEIPAEPLSRVDFSGHSRIVRAVAEAERLEHGYLFNPAPLCRIPTHAAAGV